MNANYSKKIIRLGALLSILAALLAFVVRAAEAQYRRPTVPSRLSLGDAARLAASRTAAVQSAELRVSEAQARVKQSRASLLPQVEAVPELDEPHDQQRELRVQLSRRPRPAAAARSRTARSSARSNSGISAAKCRRRSMIPRRDGARERGARRRGRGHGRRSDRRRAGGVERGGARTFARSAADATLEARTADSTLAAELADHRARSTHGRRRRRARRDARADRSSPARVRSSSSRATIAIARGSTCVARSTFRSTRRSSSPTRWRRSTFPEVRRLRRRPSTSPMRTRPDVRAADARADRRAAAAHRDPCRPAADGRVVRQRRSERPHFNHLLNTYTYGVQLSWPVFDGRRRDGQEQEQEAVARDIDVRRRDLRPGSGGRRARRAARHRVGARAGRRGARSPALAEQEVQQARDRFQAGVAGNADVVTASLTLNTARTTLIDALTSYRSRSRVALARAEGTVSQLAITEDSVTALTRIPEHLRRFTIMATVLKQNTDIPRHPRRRAGEHRRPEQGVGRQAALRAPHRARPRRARRAVGVQAVELRPRPRVDRRRRRGRASRPGAREGERLRPERHRVATTIT